MSGSIKVIREGMIAQIVISNPTKRNALSIAMWQVLRQELSVLSADRNLRCIVVRGEGDRAFAAGADIGEFETERNTVEQVARYHEEIVGPALHALIQSDLVSVAAINGDCTGGGLEIAAACDLRVAVQGARLGAAVARLGFPLALGETEIMVRKFGFPVAAELLLEGRLLEAEEAQTKGLVGRVVAQEHFAKEIERTAQEISTLSPVSLGAMKSQFRRLLTNASQTTAMERAEYYDFASSADYREGRNAFLGKRRPQFSGQ
ncbi:Enoyl-CoA hydratase/carnithine racemase [Roseovarius pacificus]|uniref:Enoyl-CoA hydratase/carnithine racemase n=1 Tax=Roseovarius pacificus TaxID=337701 RepID=A0A1M7IIQ7_9RHOB|nr:enoyl-CoA hydratase-related protein [Roseovarius pacificus]GGO61067.1 enoyl-CoA hydratase [Roseovarius pacificus]SHM40590.1 Enoyl-CoA hydratase/carnithine racemase [Roseovarius pacificus]